jgi:HlyD family secretion protein
MKNWKKTITGTLLLVVVGAAALTAWWFWGRQEPLPEGLVQANGRIEGDHYTVASKVPGRIIELAAREGESVEKGQILTRLDDAQMRAKVDQAQAAMDAQKAQLKAADMAIAVMKQEVPLTVETANAGIAHAEAAFAAAKASTHQARKDAARMKTLFEKGTVEKHSAEAADLAWTVARAEFATAMAALTQAQKRLAEAGLGWERIKTQECELKVLEAQVVQAEATLAEVRSVQNDLTIRAPASGIITTRIIDVGEVVAGGAPLFDIVDLDRLYLKVYVPGKEIGKVRLGLPAHVYTDAFPDEPVNATVRYIASRAEFTPKEVQTPDERVKLVYAVKLYLDANPDHRFTPGLPADAVIRWMEDVPWAKPRW